MGLASYLHRSLEILPRPPLLRFSAHKSPCLIPDVQWFYQFPKAKLCLWRLFWSTWSPARPHRFVSSQYVALIHADEDSSLSVQPDLSHFLYTSSTALSIGRNNNAAPHPFPDTLNHAIVLHLPLRDQSKVKNQALCPLQSLILLKSNPLFLPH